jgi:hypothetical protein
MALNSQRNGMQLGLLYMRASDILFQEARHVHLPRDDDGWISVSF